MPATVNVDDLTVVHAGSSGMAMSFPDVCKTPTPGGPVPIPYPNVAQSSDTADGSTTVKVDGNPIMLKGSNFQMSSGDEAGSAMGVASNKIKGKALPTNASFDVKVDGDNVFRLTDPMQTNSGSANTANPAVAQPPLPEGFLSSKECDEVKKKREDQGEEKASENAGMHPPHFAAIKQVAQEFNVIFYFRQTKSECLKWIATNHQPKPHSVFLANTITADKVPEVDTWLTNNVKPGITSSDSIFGVLLTAIGSPKSSLLPPDATNKGYFPLAEAYIGIVGEPQASGRKPLPFKPFVPQDYFQIYANKWITGDYDLFQVLNGVPGCEEVDQKGRTFQKIKKAINKGCSWNAIQHGPQAQWAEADGPANFPKVMAAGFKANNCLAQVPITGRNPMKAFDDKVSVIAPGGVVYLETQQDTFDALKCQECDKE